MGCLHASQSRWTTLLSVVWIGVWSLAGGGCHAAQDAQRASTNTVSVTIPMLVDEPAGQTSPGTNTPARRLRLGGKENTRLVLHVDIPQLQRLLVAPTDLQSADLVVTRTGTLAQPAILVVYRLLKDSPGKMLQPGEDFAGEPLVCAPLTQGQGSGVVELPRALTPIVVRCLSGQEAEHGLLLAVESPGERPSIELGADRDTGPRLKVVFTKRPIAQLFDYPVKPRAGVYAHVAEDGRLYYGGQRLRLWGVNRHDSPNLDIVDRLQKTGFNAMRLWPMPLPYDKDSAALGEFSKAADGQRPPMDQYDRFVAELKNHGMFVLPCALHSRSLFDARIREGLVADNSFLAELGAGQADWQAWREAARQDKLGLEMAMYFDERCMQAMKRHASNLLDHVNPYTGKRYADDEAIVGWGVQNENGFVYRTLEKGLASWPPYFHDKFQARWNDWLKVRYGDDRRLEAAWGRLEANESLQQGSVKPAPSLGERTKYPQARGDDYVHFMVDLVVAFNQDFHRYCQGHARSGVGADVVPFIFDTQFRPSVPWLASQALAGDTISIAMYEWPLTSHLTGPPGIMVLDSHTVAGKATFVYETNTTSTNPYRGEYPLRITALACRQDWDAVFWHYYHAPNENSDQYTPDERYLTESLDYIHTGYYWGGTHFGPDPIMMASIATAGRIFLQGNIDPAPAPAIYHLPADEIYSYRNCNGVNQHQDAFTCGSLLRLEPGQSGGLKVDRPVQTETAATAPVTYDQARGRMIIDTPTAKAYVGRTGGRYRFHDGVTVGDFTQPFAAFAVVSADGRPLAGPGPVRAYVCAVNNARNTGFDMDMSIARENGGFIPPLQHAAAIRSYGRAPLLVDRVGYDLWFPTRLDYLFTGYDFALRQVMQQTNSGNNLLARQGPQEVFVGELNIQRRGAAAAVPAPEEPAQAATVALANISSTAPSGAAALAGVWNPLPEIKWSDDYATAHQKLRDGNFLHGSITGQMIASGPDASFMVSDAQLLFDAPANIELKFAQGRMRRIGVTFSQPPALLEVVEAYEKQFGKPTEKQIVRNASQTSTIRWRVAGKQTELEIVVTESQGMLEIVYELRSNEVS